MYGKRRTDWHFVSRRPRYESVCKRFGSNTKDLLDNNEVAIEFLEQLHIVRRRYYRDQLLEIKKLHKEWGTNAVLDAITYCIEKDLYSASELKSASLYLQKYEEDNEKVATSGVVLLPEKYRGGAPPVRQLAIYETVMERSYS